MVTAISNVLQQLNRNLADVADRVRGSLVQVNVGRRSVGAGTIWHSQGLIVTNAHVVGGGRRSHQSGQSLRVTLPDGTVQPTRLLAKDTSLDVAALMVEADNLNPIELGESKDLQPGEWVMALGHPWGVSGAATGGVVIGSGLDLPERPPGEREWIAVSLPLRPGHSGGPLVDVHARLVGVNTMITGPNVGLAVPVHVVKRFLHRELGSTALLA